MIATFIIWGTAATLIITVLLELGQGLRLTRMNVPFLMGTILTSNRDSAKLAGTGLQMVNGWLFSVIYLLVLQWIHGSWWVGALMGLFHGVVLITVVLPVLPNLHPRMATEHSGPVGHRVLEPPGFLGLNYGRGTPWAVILPHVVFGTILGVAFHGR